MDNKAMINYLLKLVGSIEQLFFFVKDIDWDGNTEESEQLKEILNVLACSDVKSIREMQQEIATLRENLTLTEKWLKAREHELEQMTKMYQSISRKYNETLKNNVKLMEHIREMHRKYD